VTSRPIVGVCSFSLSVILTISIFFEPPPLIVLTGLHIFRFSCRLFGFLSLRRAFSSAFLFFLCSSLLYVRPNAFFRFPFLRVCFFPDSRR